MHIVIKHIELIERMDRLIHMQATGTPRELGIKLGISRTHVYRLIEIMKTLNAPVTYDFGLQSFVYQETVHFTFGFVAGERIPTGMAIRPTEKYI